MTLVIPKKRYLHNIFNKVTDAGHRYCQFWPWRDLARGDGWGVVSLLVVFVLRVAYTCDRILTAGVPGPAYLPRAYSSMIPKHAPLSGRAKYGRGT